MYLVMVEKNVFNFLIYFIFIEYKVFEKRVII